MAYVDSITTFLSQLSTLNERELFRDLTPSVAAKFDNCLDTATNIQDVKLVIPPTLTECVFQQPQERELLKVRVEEFLAMYASKHGTLWPSCVFFPVSFQKFHWCLIMVRLVPQQEYVIFDPMQNPRIALQIDKIYSTVVLPVLSDIPILSPLMKKMKRSFPSLPSQIDGHNCGVFVCMAAEYFAKRLTFESEWTSKDLYFFRLRIFALLSKNFRIMNA